MLHWPGAPAHDFVQNRQEDSSDLLKMRSDETGRLLEQHDSLMSQFKDKIDTRRFNLGPAIAKQFLCLSDDLAVCLGFA
jgi:hypothetical protein